MRASFGAGTRRWRACWVALGAVAVIGSGLGVAGAVDSTPSSFTPVVPVRVFDTRSGTGGVPAAPLGPNSRLNVSVGGGNGLPAGVKAVSLNVTVVSGTATSYLTVWPAGDPQPNASSLNWTGPTATPNAVTVGVGSGGGVSFYNNAGTIHVLADLVGYYTSAGSGASSGGLQEFKSSGTWMAPAGVGHVNVEAWGGGGGGGAAPTSCPVPPRAGGGGGAGGYVRSVVPVSQGGTYEVGVGLGGSPGGAGTASILRTSGATALVSAGGGSSGAPGDSGGAGGAGGEPSSVATGILRTGISGGPGGVQGCDSGGFGSGPNRGSIDLDPSNLASGGRGGGLVVGEGTFPARAGGSGYVVLTW